MIKNNHTPSVSIILATKNQFEVLRPVLNSLLEQDYPDFEVVVVDDCSEDMTPIALDKMSKEFPKLKFTRVFNETRFSNALTLSVGIRAATKDWLLFLTPEMKPVNKNYLRTLMSNVTDKTSLVQGGCNYIPQHSWGNYFLRLHLAKYTLDYYPYAKWFGLVPALPYNIAYKRKYFVESKGFREFLDEKFYINEWYAHSLTTKDKNVEVVLHSDAKVCLSDSYDLHDFVNQREKYLLLKKKYGLGYKGLRLIYNWGGFLVLVATVLLCLSSQYSYWGVLVFILLSLIHLISMGIILRKLKEKNFLFFEYVSRLLWPLYSFHYSLKFWILRQRKKWN
ncbi:glycosyltransferase family 2 protein [Halosquirtibacter laminarini]|uniref:Glycosyltransferase family 2 protein n=1 Tax=Halosquirtibacter laminarini TaxID=3374600 RepID=A0AC61NMS2_9BACT|nr:glycosyltransferase family 2 protein [Prolixibacteraceae bacterium]